jgi:Do/DeqQ family serine protease
VLVGLLAGILFMLVFADAPPAPSASTRVAADRVELGDPRPPVSPPSADSMIEMPEPAALNKLFRDVAGRVTPAVVFIQVRTEAPGAPEDGYHEFEDDMRRFFRNPFPRQSVGSGVLISTEGHIVTNNHVVERASEIQVTLADKRQFPAEVVGTDASTDLAVIKVDTEETLPSIRLGNSDSVRVGDWVIAVGNPFRLTSTVTAGIVSALGRQVNIIEDAFRIEDFIQTDAAINPGNSGGALVNMRGELVGINTAIATESGSYEGYGFAVPTNLMERVAQDLIAYGEVRRGFLGISIQEVNADMADEMGLGSIRGVYVGNVRDGGAADRSGMASGDVVLRMAGEKVDAPNELQSTVARFRPGDVLQVTVWRDGAERTLRVRLMGRDAPAYAGWMEPESSSQSPAPSDDTDPAPPATTDNDASIAELDAWGVGLRDLKTSERLAFGVQGGVYVAYVEQGKPAAAAGLPRDVALVRVNGTTVATPEAVGKQLDRATGPVLVQVSRRDQTKAFYEIP